MKKACVYARVSTDKDDQINSLEGQIQYFKKFINQKPEYEFTEIYYDKGVGGTSTKKRKGFIKMIEDAKNGMYDIIITKEVSRFARNTIDTLMYTRELKKHNVGVLFVEDNINTLSGDGELRLSLMATLAQEESRKISERVKWGQKRRQEEGVVFGSHVYGYNLKDGKLLINEQEAEVVKEIFTMYATGYGLQKIASYLNQKGIKSKKGGEWKSKPILYILRNEKYKGTLISRKYKVSNYIDQVTEKRNDDEKIVIENNHSAIVSEELWNKVQKEINKRQDLYVKDGKYASRYLFSGKIICNKCGDKYRRKRSNKKYFQWTCKTSDREGKKICSGQSYREEFLEKGCNLLLKQAKMYKKENIKLIKNKLEVTLGKNYYKKDIEETTSKLKKLKNRLKNYYDMRADGEISKEELNELSEDIKVKISQTEKLLEKYTNADQEIIDKVDFLKKIEDILNNIEDNIDTTNGKEIFDFFIYKIFAYDRNNFVIQTSLNIFFQIKKDKLKFQSIDECNVEIQEIDTSSALYPYRDKSKYFCNNKDIIEVDFEYLNKQYEILIERREYNEAAV